MKNTNIGNNIDSVSLYGIIIQGLNNTIGVMAKRDSTAALLLTSFLIVRPASNPDASTTSVLIMRRNRYFFPRKGIVLIKASKETINALLG